MLLAAGTVFLAGAAAAQSSFHARVRIEGSTQGKKLSHADVVVWLTPLGAKPDLHPGRFRLAQKNKQFEPHLLVVPVGSIVDFPNQDPFFHNVFSLYKGKRFDLGLYEAGSSRAVHFDRPGVSFIFCNIHPWMSAVIMTMETPYFGVSDSAGDVIIPRVPPGRYRLQVWYERSSSQALAQSTQQIIFPTENDLSLHVTQTLMGPLTHKNKFGQDYEAAPLYSP